MQSTTHRGDLVEGHCLRQNQEVFGYVWFKTTPQQSSDDTVEGHCLRQNQEVFCFNTTPQQSSDDTDDEPEVHIALKRMMTFEAFV